MPRDTKTRILGSALEIFARDGYAGTNIKDISESVGIVKSAFYRHFESKEEIWDAVIEMMIQYYEDHFGSAESMLKIPGSVDELYEMTMEKVHFTVHDRKVVLMRHILCEEQFRDERVKRLATRYFIDDTEEIFEKIFSGMMDTGIIVQTDPRMLAFSYTAPITVLVHLCDREPERADETINKIREFIRNFISVYEKK